MKKTDVVKWNFERAITLDNKNITSTSNLSQDVEELAPFGSNTAKIAVI